MLTSTEPWDEFRPMVTERFFIRYSNSRPSSRATAGSDNPLTTAIIHGTGSNVRIWSKPALEGKAQIGGSEEFGNRVNPETGNPI